MATIALYAGKINNIPKCIRNIKWLFDPAKRDVHVRLTELLGGIFGVAKKED